MDQQMPIMDGHTATKVIRDIEKKTGGHVPVLGVTANVRDAQQDEMMNSGMDDIIHKPYSTQELVKKIKHLIETESKQ
jgi:CheY-like chemotaxis protein